MLNFLHRHQTAVRGLANNVLELQGGVVDAEALAQHAVDAVEDQVALRRRDVGDGDVAGEAWVCEPRLQTCRSWTSSTPSMPASVTRISASEMPRGVPSRRMLSVSRTMESDDQRISAAMASEAPDRSRCGR